MVKRKTVVINPTGLHLRPAGTLCNAAIECNSKVKLHVHGKSYNAKSVLSVLSACVKQGDEIEISCSGEDEDEALDKLIALIENGFGEL